MTKMSGLFLLIAVLQVLLSSAQTWKAYADSGRVYQEKSNADKAIGFYNQSLDELRKDSSQTETYAKIAHGLSTLYRVKTQYEKAMAICNEAKKIREDLFGKQHPLYAASCNSLGLIYKDMTQFAKAESLYLEARTIYKINKLQTSSANAAVSLNLGVVYRSTGKFEEAELCYTEAKDIREKLTGKTSSEYATSCNNMAILYKDMGRFDEAEKLYLEAKQIRESNTGKLHIDYAASCNNLANLYIAMGFYDKAELMLLEALDISGKVSGKDHQQYITSCLNTGNLYAEIGAFDRAESFYMEVKNALERRSGKENQLYAAVCINLGNMNIEKNNLERGEAFLLEAKSLYEKKFGKDNPDYGQILLNLARLYKSREEYDKAMPHMQEARLLFEKKLGTEHPLYGSGCKSLGIYYYETGQYDLAEPLLLQSASINQKTWGEEHPDCVYDNNDLASLYWMQGKKEKAFTYFKKMFEAYLYNTHKVFQFTSENEKTSYKEKYRVQYDNFLSFVKANPEVSRTNFIYDVLIACRNMISAHSSQMKEALISKGDSTVMNKYNDWISLRAQQAYWLSKPVKERNKRDSLINEKATVVEKHLTRLSSEFNQSLRLQRTTCADIIKSLSVSEAVIEFAEFRYFDNKVLSDSTYYLALVLRKNDTTPALSILFEKKQLESIMGHANNPGQAQVNTLYRSKVQKDGRSLYDLIWKPLEKNLAGVRTIYFAPAGSLFKISFAALPVDEKQVLSDKYRLVQLHNTSSLTEKTPATIISRDKIVLLGGILYDVDAANMQTMALKSGGGDIALRAETGINYTGEMPEFNFLPGTGKEIEGINKLAETGQYNVSLFNGADVTEELFKKLSGEKSPAILHIATHGFFFPDRGGRKRDDRLGGSIVFRQSDNPLIRSGLALAGANNAWKGKPVSGVEDGILTAYEVSNMYLPHTKLAVLSACETGLGDIQGSEGVYGLQRAFKIAGVQNLVMSLWKVPDMETAEFMQEFYKNLFAKQPIQEAFQYAQSVMKNKYKDDPYKWAAWVLLR